MAKEMNGVSLCLFFLIVLHCPHFNEAATNMLCVVPERSRSSATVSLNGGSSCPGTTILRLSLAELVDSTRAVSSIQSNTTIIFLPGQHLMPSNRFLYVADVQELVLTGQVNGKIKSLPEIDCQGSESAFQLTNIVGLSISNLKFSRCGKLLSYSNRQEMATLFLANITNLLIQQLEIINGVGYGLYGVNIVGHSSVANSHFADNTRGGNTLVEYIDLDQVSCMKMHHLLIEDSSFKMGQSIMQPDPQSPDIGAGFSIQLWQSNYSVNITLLRTIASDNIARRGPNFQFDSKSSAPNTITLQDCTASNGTVLFGGGSGFAYSHFHLSPPNLTPCSNASIIPNRTLILLNNSRFTDSKGGKNPSYLSEFASNAISVVFYLRESGALLHFVSIQNCDISNNIGDSGVGFYGQVSGRVPLKGYVQVEIIGSSFRNNTSTTFRLNRLSVIWLVDMDSVKISNVPITDNTGSGINAINSNVYFEGINNLSNNIAYNGGGVALHGSSLVYLKPYTIVALVSNKASNVGGGIYVAQNIDVTVSAPQCFFQFYDFDFLKQSILKLVNLQFADNSAGLAGDDLYGGSLELCYSNQTARGYRIFPFISGMYGNRTLPNISSKPVRACFCNESSDETDCSNFVHSITAYPGSLFNISVIAVGQMIFHHPAGTPSAIYSAILPSDPNPGTIPGELQTQGVGRYCSPLTFQVRSRHVYETIVMSVKKTMEVKQRSQILISSAEHWFNHLHAVIDPFLEIPLYINVSLLACPLGFVLTDEGVCSCAQIFIEHGISCSINTNTLYRTPPIWIGTYSNSDNSTPIYIVHQNCPYDYCIPSSIHVTLSDHDVQCASNRTGTLCGGCKPGLSSVLGGSQCKECSSIYILLLIPFALAGVLLVFLLLGINLTVTVGTINGLLFYVNVVRENYIALFPSATDSNILTVFIAWLNLDFGITTCFYSGMDMYAKAWLQFVFPVYIWLLAAFIIISSHYSMTVAKSCGRNVVQVLVTLFLLSYIKLQRAIITGLSFTVMSRSDNITEFVWLSDPTVNYVQGKHIYLFIASVAFFVCLFLPYTFFILFGPCLLARTNYRRLSCIHRLKPFFDAYFGPYKDKHRYWTGLLLFARVLLVLLSAGNVFGDPSVNLLAASIVSYILILLLWQSGGVYKLWVINYLESFFFLNLGLLSTVALYIRLSGSNQYVATYLSCGLAFAAFLVILLYHILMYTPINVSKRNCTKYIASKFSFLQSLHTSLSSQDTSMTIPRRQPSSHDLELIGRSVDRDPDTNSNDSLSDTDSGQEPREVTSMLISFNNGMEPTFQFGTVQR